MGVVCERRHWISMTFHSCHIVSSRIIVTLSRTCLRCPISSNRGLPSPALLFGTRPVWYWGEKSTGGWSALGKSCRKRSMVNCALGLRREELADACAISSLHLRVMLRAASMAAERCCEIRRLSMTARRICCCCTGYIAQRKKTHTHRSRNKTGIVSERKRRAEGKTNR